MILLMVFIISKLVINFHPPRAIPDSMTVPTSTFFLTSCREPVSSSKLVVTGQTKN